MQESEPPIQSRAGERWEVALKAHRPVTAQTLEPAVHTAWFLGSSTALSEATVRKALRQGLRRNPADQTSSRNVP